MDLCFLSHCLTAWCRWKSKSFINTNCTYFSKYCTAFIFNFAFGCCRRLPALQLCDAIPTTVVIDDGVLRSHCVKGRYSHSLSLASGPFSSIWNVAAKISFLPEMLEQDMGWYSLLLWMQSSDLWLKPITVYFSAFIELWSSSSSSSHFRHFFHCSLDVLLLSPCAIPSAGCKLMLVCDGKMHQLQPIPAHFLTSVPTTSTATMLLQQSLVPLAVKKHKKFISAYFVYCWPLLCILCHCALAQMTAMFPAALVPTALTVPWCPSDWLQCLCNSTFSVSKEIRMWDRRKSVVFFCWNCVLSYELFGLHLVSIPR